MPFAFGKLCTCIFPTASHLLHPVYSKSYLLVLSGIIFPSSCSVMRFSFSMVWKAHERAVDPLNACGGPWASCLDLAYLSQMFMVIVPPCAFAPATVAAALRLLQLYRHRHRYIIIIHSACMHACTQICIVNIYTHTHIYRFMYIYSIFTCYAYTMYNARVCVHVSDGHCRNWWTLQTRKHCLCSWGGRPATWQSGELELVLPAVLERFDLSRLILPPDFPRALRLICNIIFFSELVTRMFSFGGHIYFCGPDRLGPTEWSPVMIFLYCKVGTESRSCDFVRIVWDLVWSLVVICSCYK